MKFEIFFTSLLFSLCNQSMAENGCPDGMTPFQNGNDPTPKCYPIQGGQNTVPAQPRGRWLTRWGAIATDESIGRLGAVNNFSSKRLASKAAVNACKADGGVQCETRLSYYNQCAALSWGDEFYSASGAATVELAIKIASQKCDARTKNCKIVYADCSPPVWVQ